VQFVKTWATRLAFAILLILATLVIGGAVDARRRHPDLKPWHELVPDDVDAGELTEDFTFERWLQREAEVFAEVDALERHVGTDDQTPVNRYFPSSATHYSRLGRNWNRTFELVPADIRGGAVLVHGLTDSPYSMRAVAELLREEGFYILALRMPGHGTVPAGLVDADWEDWLAAVRMGMRHTRQRVGPDRPLLLVGYSNGGALAVKYATEAIDRPQDPRPSRLLLLSPMIGVTPAARLAWWISRLGIMPYFEKARWLDVLPEYNPIKYNSFPANAAFQTASLTRALHRDLARLTTDGRIAALPPMLTFQSAVDATVSTPAVVHALYDRLPVNGSELVLFDLNHRAGINAFVRADDLTLVERLFDRTERNYRRTLLTNRSTDTTDIVARTIERGERSFTDRDLHLGWPPGVFSLTHIAVPFPVDDPLYGTEPVEDGSGLFRLGRLSPRGERAVLIAGADTFVRLTTNPFFPYMAERIRAWAAGAVRQEDR
jgi:alpha-beta hydrolase superfamily lysophospholipase